MVGLFSQMANIHNNTQLRINSPAPRAIIPVPYLPPVSSSDLPRYKLTPVGVVEILNYPLQSHVSGSASHVVDINGRLISRGDLRRETAPKEDPKKKKTRNKKPDSPPGNREEKPKPPREYSINASKVRARIRAMLNTMAGRYELYFVTISFPEGTKDDICYQSFNTWLTTLRQKKRIRGYIWVTERQKNGTLHFHLCIPHYVDIWKFNSAMRVVLGSLAKKGLLPVSSNFIYTKYNGVDLAKRKDKTGRKRVVNFADKRASKALAFYLTKYVTKNLITFTRLAWHSSREYSCLFTSVNLTDTQINAFVDLIETNKGFTSEHFKFNPWKTGPPGAFIDLLFGLNSYLHYQQKFFHRQDRGRNWVPVQFVKSKK